MDFGIIIQEYSLGDPLPKLQKPFCSVEQDGRQAELKIEKNFKRLLFNQWMDFEIIRHACYDTPFIIHACYDSYTCML